MAARMEVKANKRLGQHFLTDESVIAQLVRLIRPQPAQNLLEIGPGLGALTLPLLAECGRLTAVELDKRVLEPLARKAAPVGELTVLQRDFLTVDLVALAGGGEKWRLVGNLPYNLSSPILFHCLAQRDAIIDMHFMLQKEVVDRICALPDESAYGRLSIMIQLWCEAESLLEIPPAAFHPPPKVDSGIVRLRPLPAPRWPIDHLPTFEHLVRMAFSARRKMIRKSLKAYFTATELEALAMEPTARPETLSGGDFAALSNAIYRKGNTL